MTRITHVGFSAGQFGKSGDLNALDTRIGMIADLGANSCELNPVRLDVVSACRIIPDRLVRLKEILRRHSLRYSLHAPIAINLMDLDHIDLQVKAAVVSLELAAECEAQIVVLHPGRSNPVRWVDQQRTLLSKECEILGDLAEKAAALGVRIAYENISPNPQVIAGNETSYSLDLVRLAEQIEAVGHPALVACLDVSHAIQGAKLQGFDMYEQASRLAPVTGHIHFSDSTGVPATLACKNEGEKLFFGIGDMHAPVGWGDVDFDRLASCLPILEDTSIAIELKDNHFGHSAEQTISAARSFAQAVNGLA